MISLTRRWYPGGLERGVRAPGYRSGLHAPIPAAGMDDTFSYRAAPLPLRRRIDPRKVKLVVVAFVVVSCCVLFAKWVIDSERRSEVLASGQAVEAPLVGHFEGVDAEAAAEAPALPDGRRSRASRRTHRAGDRARGGSRARHVRRRWPGPAECPGTIADLHRWTVARPGHRERRLVRWPMGRRGDGHVGHLLLGPPGSHRHHGSARASCAPASPPCRPTAPRGDLSRRRRCGTSVRAFPTPGLDSRVICTPALVREGGFLS